MSRTFKLLTFRNITLIFFLFQINFSFSQQIPKEPFQTEALYSKLKVTAIKDYLFTSLISNKVALSATITKLNEFGQPIESKHISLMGKQVILANREKEFIYDGRKCIRVNKFDDEGLISEYTIFKYNNVSGLLVSAERYNEKNEKTEQIEYSYNPTISKHEKFSKSKLTESVERLYDKDLLLSKVKTNTDKPVKSEYIWKNDNKTLIEEKHQGNYVGISEFIFDDNQLLLENSVFGSEKEPMFRHTYEYAYQDDSKNKQTKKYYFDENDKKCDSLNAKKVLYVYINNSLFNDGSSIFKTIDGIILNEVEYYDMSMMIKDGNAKYYYDDGKIKVSMKYKLNKLEGEYIMFYPDGKIKRKDIYDNDKFVSGQCFDVNEKEVVYFPLRVLPVFVGTSKSLQEEVRNNFKYPNKYKNSKKELNIKAAFYIDMDGKIIDIIILKGISKEMDDELIRVLQSLPNHKPGFIEGEKSSFKYTYDFEL